MKRAVQFDIIRDVRLSEGISMPMAVKPVCVAQLTNEALFAETKALKHGETIFLDSLIHDCDWTAGKFCYFPRISPDDDDEEEPETLTLLVVYEMIEE